MKNIWIYIAAALVALGALALIMAEPAPVAIARPQPQPPAGASLSIVTWNLGYAGLGADSDFIADGGKSVFPPSFAAVTRNVAGIVSAVRGMDSDVFVFPEAAKPGPANLWHDLLGALTAALPGYERLFSPDFFTRWAPWPLRAEHGLAIYARREMKSVTVEPLPLEATKIGGLISRAYSARVVRIAAEGGKPDWVVIGVHLAAFDEGGNTRRAQLARTLEIAKALYAEGHPVVIAGDYNLVLADTHWPSTTGAKDLAWVHPFPEDILPEGWRIGADPATPSVRTNERPYVAGQNFTTIIDGFILSPGLAIEAVKTTDLGFRFSDHQPVRIVVKRAD